MVVFTCAHCGEPVKKPMVSKHYERKCYRRNPDLCCVDCLKDFRGNEYEAHTKCISENERYGAKGSVQAASVNKGEQKQQLWSECIQNILSSIQLRDDERRLISLLSKHENVPRKKAKFQNFLNSAYKSSRFSNDLIDRVWVQMEKVFKETKEGANNSKQGNAETNGNAVEEKNDSSESKKRKHEEEENIQGETSVSDESEIKKSKKSKKNKVKEAETAEKVENNVNEDETPTENKSDKKKKKKKKNQDSEPSEETAVVESELAVEPEPLTNGKSKKKKDEKGETNEVQETINDKENLNESDKNNVEFSWVENIKSILSKKNLNEEILIKKIEKKVLKRFSKTTGAEATEKESKKFMKRLKKMKNLTLKGEYVIVHSIES